jgi:hypothetical protein
VSYEKLTNARCVWEDKKGCGQKNMEDNAFMRKKKGTYGDDVLVALFDGGETTFFSFDSGLPSRKLLRSILR